MTASAATAVRCNVVRAGEAAWRSGLAHDAAGMIAIVTVMALDALVDELSEDIDLGALVGGQRNIAFGPLAVIERGATLD